MTAHLQRGALFMESRRWALAEREFLEHLAEFPDDARGYIGLANCLLELDRARDALEHANHAVALEPDHPDAHVVRTIALFQLGRLPQALAAADEVVRLAPDHCCGFGLRSLVLIHQRNWPAALAAAEEALRRDPDYVFALNARGEALRALGRRKAAQESFQLALARDPENESSHAGAGWILLETGEYQGALEHFRSALRADPTFDPARLGMLEASRLRNPIVSFFRRWTDGARRIWNDGGVALVVLASIVGSGGLIIMIALLGVMVCWILDDLINLWLRRSPTLWHSLTRDERRGALLTTGLLTAALALFLCAAFGQPDFLLGLGGICLGTAFPATRVFRCAQGWPQGLLALIVGSLAAWGVYVNIAGLFSPRAAIDGSATWFLAWFAVMVVAWFFPRIRVKGQRNALPT